MEKKSKSFLEINYVQSFKTESSINYKILKQSCKRDFEVKNNEDIFFISGEGKDKIVINNEESFNNFIKNNKANGIKLFMHKFVLSGKKIESKKTLMNEIDELKKDIKNLENIKNSMRDDFSFVEKELQKKTNELNNSVIIEMNKLKNIEDSINNKIKIADEKKQEEEKLSEKLNEQKNKLKEINEEVEKNKKIKEENKEKEKEYYKLINDIKNLQLVKKEEKEKYEKIKKENKELEEHLLILQNKIKGNEIINVNIETLKKIVNKEKEYDIRINEMKKKYEENLKTKFSSYMKNIEEDLIDKLTKKYEEKNQEYFNELKGKEKEIEKTHKKIKEVLEENKEESKELNTILSSNIYCHGIKCNECGNEIIGIRYKCSKCKEYNLCEKCELKNFINKKHLDLFYKIRKSKPKKIINFNDIK